jgi:ABC-type bacteriocin/lantibiotic exporter with double-glycine peptidase domain
MKSHIAFILFLAVVLSSCSIEKRIYQPGYFISGRSSCPKEEKIQKKILPELFSESVTTNTKEESSEVIEHKDTASIRLNESASRIEASNETKIQPQKIPISTALASDSIPDESKVLNEKYEKNHALKKKIKKIGFYPIVLFLIVFSAFLLLIIPWFFYVIYDSIMVALLSICAAALILVIPFAIIYLILSIITKKQRRKLRKMGVVK